MERYIHFPAGSEVESFAWPFVLLEEFLIRRGEGDVLCLLCESVLGSACTGIGSLRYVLVQGTVHEWKKYCSSEGYPVSTLAPVCGDLEKDHIREQLRRAYPYLQVCFYSGN